ncbi:MULTISPECIES: type I methionyl aminopeptidase [Brevibacillus]|uniref:Methionine aminopeptidase n=1 Tax=Brevibacillus laterosporus TaxID=1465 RepID=A0AAP3DDV2_BRELA|nr:MULTISPECIES: type I methionyl aminopeptidase [Brevibacillus]ATO49130.1 type I methionyl aminopeptidase [Brevibacillus laterosporus DSM 25]AYB40790.1 type I methionyl aminopeptidase [Brevibacillus laterosporus]MBG9772842.1 methionine aminopeptidase [Brevibacillus laterosporus]MBG9787673.1 methionine aminopeptidase [Brevibacillus laterosporus]MBG9800522.1 methionine aminopeptidase [Brevibacillus laterosporus]
MIVIKTKEEIELMRQAGIILASIHQKIATMIQPGITTWEIDQFVERYLKEHGATPEQKGYHGYPYATCASVNDVICHGFPTKKELKDGDIVTIDMVVNLNGWLADSAWSYGVGQISEEADRLLTTTKESLYLGIEQAVVGNRIGDISHAIQKFAEERGFSVVRDFTGHGIGKKMHEDPYVPHYGPAGKGVRLKEGMVLTIEPMLNVGTYHAVVDEEDGWTARTRDGKLSAQYEHTLAITADGPQILTQL